MAPERFDGEGDHRVDVYALGCVLYEVLTGWPAFRGDTVAVYVYAHVSGATPRPSRYRPDLPEDIDEVVARALAKNPDERYASAGALADAASAALTIRRPKRTPPSMPKRTPPSI
jgi:serine/threonine-protein kinase